VSTGMAACDFQFGPPLSVGACQSADHLTKTFGRSDGRIGGYRPGDRPAAVSVSQGEGVVGGDRRRPRCGLCLCVLQVRCGGDLSCAQAPLAADCAASLALCACAGGGWSQCVLPTILEVHTRFCCVTLVASSIARRCECYIEPSSRWRRTGVC